MDAPKLVSELRSDLDWIVMKCLEKDRARRYETANGMGMDIQRHLDNEPVVARPPSAVYRFRKLVRRKILTGDRLPVAESLDNLAVVLCDGGTLAEAETHLRESLLRPMILPIFGLLFCSSRFCGRKPRRSSERTAPPIWAAVPAVQPGLAIDERRGTAQGRFASSVEWVNKTVNRPVESAKRDAKLDIEAYMVLAMAQYRLQQTDAARAALAKGVEIERTKLPKLENGDLGDGWLEWITAHALMREAHALIEGRAKTEPPT